MLCGWTIWSAASCDLYREKRKERDETRTFIIGWRPCRVLFSVCLNSAMTSSTLYYVPTIGADEANSSIGYHLVTKWQNLALLSYHIQSTTSPRLVVTSVTRRRNGINEPDQSYIPDSQQSIRSRTWCCSMFLISPKSTLEGAKSRSQCTTELVLYSSLLYIIYDTATTVTKVYSLLLSRYSSSAV